MRHFYYTLFLLLSGCHLPAQYLDLGISLGGANYLGDLTPSSFFASVGETGGYAGVRGRYHFNDRFALRVGGNFGVISAYDADAVRRNGDRWERNLHFRSRIREIEMTLQFNLLPYRPLQSQHRFIPYLFIGLAGFEFNPQASYQDQWYDLQPLGTEGQGLSGYPEKYSLTQIAVPFGLGLTFALTKNLNAGFELSMRKTFTDYLDDVSSDYPDLNELAMERGDIARRLSWRTDEILPDARPPVKGAERGDPRDLDWYIFGGFSLSYTFIAPDNRRLKAKRGKVRCPKL